MKKILSFLAILVMAVTSVFADVTVVTTQNQLQTAVNAGGEVQLGADIDLSATITVASDKTVTLDLNGHVLNAGNLTAPANEGDKASVIYNEGILTIIDSNPTAAHSGSYSALPVGGVLTGGQGCRPYSKSFGGAIFNSGTLTMTDGTITGNSAQTAGGGFYSTGTGIAILKNVTISGNTVTSDQAGGIYSSSSLTLDGCTITGNTSVSKWPSGGVYFWNNITTTVTLKNKNIIKDNTTTYKGTTVAANLCLSGQTAPQLVTLDNIAGSEIGVTTMVDDVVAAARFTTNGSAADAQYFFADDDKYSFSHNTAGYLETVKITKVTNTDDLQKVANDGGYAELTGDIDLTATISVPSSKTVTLDLNGHVLNAGNLTAPANNGDKASVIYNEGALNIIDSNPTAAHTDWNTSHPTSSGNADLSSITGGVLTGGQGYCETDNHRKGGAIYNSLGTITMTGGAICGNSAEYMGAIANYSGSLSLKNVTVSGNTATAGHAGAICTTGSLSAPGSLTLDGCTITNNTSTASDENSVLSGGVLCTNVNHSATLKNKNIIKDNTTTINGTAVAANLCLSGETVPQQVTLDNIAGSEIGVSTMVNYNVQAAQFTSNGSADDAIAFFSDNSDYGVVYNATDHYLETKEFTKVTTQDQLQTAVNAGGEVQLAADIDLTATITVPSGKTVTLDLNGHVLNAGNLTAPKNNGDKASVIYNQGTLTIIDSNHEATHTGDLSATKGGVLTGGKGFKPNSDICGGAIYNSGTLTMIGGTISGNSAKYGAGIYNYSGKATLNGVTISNNTATSSGGGIYNSGTLTMTGGTITGNSALYDAGIYNYSGEATLNGVTISNNTTTYRGGGICNKGTLTMTGGTISGNSALSGAAIYNDSGKVTLNGVTISNNTATSSGGIYNDGTLTMTGGTITGNSAQTYAGFCNYSGKATLNGVTISNNTATNSGGGIYINSGTCEIKECTISGNSAQYGAGIFNNSGEATLNGVTISNNAATVRGGGIHNYRSLVLDGCTITGNTSANNQYSGGVYCWAYDESTVTLKNKNIIKDNTTTINGTAVAANLCLSGKTAPQLVTLDGLAEGSEIGVATMVNDVVAAAKFTAAEVAQGAKTYFTSDNSDYGVVYNTTGHYLEIKEFTKVTTTEELQAACTECGAVKVVADIDLTATITVASGKDITLELNGHVLNAGNITAPANNGDKASVIYNEGAMTIIDSNPTAAHTDWNTSHPTSSGNADLSSITGGVLTGGQGYCETDNHRKGGAIYNSLGTITMTGGAICGNSAEYMGAIANYSGSLSLNNVTVSGNTATAGHAGAICTTGSSSATGSLTLDGCTITNNTSTASDENSVPSGGVLCINVNHTVTLKNKNIIKDNTTTINGTAVAANLCLSGETAPQLVTLDGLAEGSEIGVTTMVNDKFAAAKFTAGEVAVGTTAYFTPDNSDYYYVSYNTKGKYIETKAYIKTTEALQAAVNEGGNVKLEGDIDLTATISVPSGKTVTLDLDGHVLNAGNLTAPANNGDKAIVIYNQGTLTIIDSNHEATHTGDLSATKGGVLTGGKGFMTDSYICGGAIYNSGTLTMTGGTISGNSAKYGAGIFNNYGNATLNGVTISNNTATMNGGGIYNNGNVIRSKGYLKITGGTIRGNSAQHGAAILNDYGNATLNGVTISNNTATATGGGIYSYGTFNMTGGTITGNSANRGAAIYDDNGIATLNGVTISNNTATATGGGIYIYSGTCEIKECTITGNSAPYGAGIFNNSGKAILNGVTVSNNTATMYGGGIHNYGTLTMTGGTITGNSANYGAAIYNDSKEVTLNDVTISNNKATTTGGGIHNYGTLTMTGGTITGNLAKYGAAIFNYAGDYACVATLNNVTISNNTATTTGGGIYNDGTLTMTGGTITGNSAQYGAAIYNFYDETTLHGVTISNNTATTTGGGIHNDGSLVIDGCTITGNTSASNQYSGGVYCLAYDGSTVTLKNKNIIKDNTTTINGTAVAANLCLSGETAPQLVTLDGLAEGSEIGVIAMVKDKFAAARFTTNGAETDLQYFTSDDNKYELKYNADGYLETVLVVTLNSQGYGTFSSATDVDVETDGIEVYSAAVSGQTITLTKQENKYIPAGIGVLLYGGETKANTKVTFKAKTNTDAIAENDLKATTTAKDAIVTKPNNGTVWALNGNKFLKYTATEFVANRAYLITNQSDAKTLSIVFGDATGVTSVNNEQLTANNGGKYLENGRIVILKNGRKYTTSGQLEK